MHIDSPASTTPAADTNGRPWWTLLSRYHWFVLTVAALGWLFDCLDQQLFNLARVPAMKALVSQDPKVFNEYGGYATSIFLIGWAAGGLAFGVLGDRIGRAKTMLLTILIYSLFTGLSALSVSFWDFALYRFLTGLGVGGEFAVGVALVAEVMPDKARPFALGLLQALSAIGNITAAVISIVFAQFEEAGLMGAPWRWMFVIGTLPALLALLIRRRLKEPERWQKLAESGASSPAAPQLGSYTELFSNPTWRKRAITGLILASAGVVGLWGIGFFSIDLTRSVFQKTFMQEARDAGAGESDRQFVSAALTRFDEYRRLKDDKETNVKPEDLVPSAANRNDARILLETALVLHAEQKTVNADSVLDALEQKNKAEADANRESGYITAGASVNMAEQAKNIVKRSRKTAGRLSLWAGLTSVMINLGAFFGIYAFSYVSHWTSRRAAFAMAFIAAFITTAGVFWYLDDVSQVFWMIPIMGFCQLSLFGGYAIYFPELFPTRLRSTGTSFCYNVGRFVAAIGPSALGLLTSRVFAGYSEPMRYAGVTMCAVFLLGLITVPFLPETKGKPLPE